MRPDESIEQPSVFLALRCDRGVIRGCVLAGAPTIGYVLTLYIYIYIYIYISMCVCIFELARETSIYCRPGLTGGYASALVIWHGIA